MHDPSGLVPASSPSAQCGSPVVTRLRTVTALSGRAPERRSRSADTAARAPYVRFVELHDDDIPGQQTPMQHAVFTRSLITGSVAVVFGLVLIIVGLVHRDNVVVPVLAVIGGALVLGYDFTSARRRKRDLEGPDA